MENTAEYSLLNMLKALADESRLALIRLLSEGEHTVGELAQLLDLGEPTISHHLSRLRENRLVSLRMAGNQRYYRANETGLAEFKRQVMQIEKPAPVVPVSQPDNEWIAALGWSAADQQVLRDYTQGQKLVRLPSKRGKTQVILRWLATLFTPERMYTEAEVNEVIKAVYAEDFVSLRRDLIDMGYLRRERGGGKYWLAPADEERRNWREG
ncbi:MAG: metalloregulator ArsR/SmtB family transcription factor [Leptolinea sp.]|nr:metalloregulator ArsR/SmtB family transcription factor [Leptolinea sp.]